MSVKFNSYFWSCCLFLAERKERNIQRQSSLFEIKEERRNIFLKICMLYVHVMCILDLVAVKYASAWTLQLKELKWKIVNLICLSVLLLVQFPILIVTWRTTHDNLQPSNKNETWLNKVCSGGVSSKNTHVNEYIEYSLSIMLTVYSPEPWLCFKYALL